MRPLSLLSLVFSWDIDLLMVRHLMTLPLASCPSCPSRVLLGTFDLLVVRHLMRPLSLLSLVFSWDIDLLMVRHLIPLASCPSCPSRVLLGLLVVRHRAPALTCDWQRAARRRGALRSGRALGRQALRKEGGWGALVALVTGGRELCARGRSAGRRCALAGGARTGCATSIARWLRAS
jgi:hypothetical protein